MSRSRVAALMVSTMVVTGMLLADIPAVQATTSPPARAGASLTVESFNDYVSVSGNGVAPGESVIPVSGMPSTIADLSVYLRGLGARDLGRVKITIVTPDGASVDLIEDACEGSTAPVSGKDFIVDDRGSAPLPRVAPDTTEACWSGLEMIQVSNNFFDLPSEPTQLAALNGHAANGDWKIRVSSDDAQDVRLSGGFGFILAADDPDTVLTAGPVTGEQSASSVSFGFGSPNVAGATFHCSLDGGAFTTCLSPRTLTGLRAGGHTFRVRAATGTGIVVVDPTPAQVDWIVQPETRISSGPVGGTTSGSSVSFGFNAPNAPAATFECSRDGAAFTTCSSPRPVRNLAAGSHTFRVRAKVLAGAAVVLDPTPARVAWQVVPPDTRVTRHPRRRTTKRRATFAFTSTEAGSTFQCKLDGRRWRACTSPRRVRVKPGRHVFRVRAIDSAGNRDHTPAVAHWRRIPS